MNGIPVETANTEAGAAAEEPTPAKRPRVATQGPRCAVQGQVGHEGHPGEEGYQRREVGPVAQKGKRRQPEETLKATGWQAHYADVRIMPTCVGNPARGAGIAAMESA